MDSGNPLVLESQQRPILLFLMFSRNPKRSEAVLSLQDDGNLNLQKLL